MRLSRTAAISWQRLLRCLKCVDSSVAVDTPFKSQPGQHVDPKHRNPQEPAFTNRKHPAGPHARPVRSLATDRTITTDKRNPKRRRAVGRAAASFSAGLCYSLVANVFPPAVLPMGTIVPVGAKAILGDAVKTGLVFAVFQSIFYAVRCPIHPPSLYI